MKTPFDEAIQRIRLQGFHNHRQEEHSDTVSEGIVFDLRQKCAAFRKDEDAGIVRVWYNVQSPGDRRRKIDLFVGEPLPGSSAPDIKKVRIALENKSVITAHRNKTNRFDDLQKTLEAVWAERSEAVLVATVLVGLAERVLNVPDRVKTECKSSKRDFELEVRPRLSTGDVSLWAEFPFCVSKNHPADPAQTAKLFRSLHTRTPAHTHVAGFDYVLLVPVFIDNVNPPAIPRPNALGIDVDAEYQNMLDQICKAYTARWHL